MREESSEGRRGGEGGEGKTEGRGIRTGVKIKLESAAGTNPYSLSSLPSSLLLPFHPPFSALGVLV